MVKIEIWGVYVRFTGIWYFYPRFYGVFKNNGKKNIKNMLTI